MVKITNDYYFERDARVKNYTLFRHEYREKKTRFGAESTGEMHDAYDRIGYYANIQKMCEAAAEDYVSRKADAGEVTNIHEWLTEYRNAVKELVAAINGNDTPESNEN